METSNKPKTLQDFFKIIESRLKEDKKKKTNKF